jgi:hypothetical protein
LGLKAQGTLGIVKNVLNIADPAVPQEIADMVSAIARRSGS